jgi:hypothetical protein
MLKSSNGSRIGECSGLNGYGSNKLIDGDKEL